MTGKATPPVFADRNEALVLVLLTFLSVVGILYHFLPAATVADKWRLTVFSKPPVTSMISRPAEKRLIVTGKLGPAEIEWDDHGKVRIASSTCPCRTCVNMGWSDSGALICVPNGLMVEPLQNEAASVDAVTR